MSTENSFFFRDGDRPLYAVLYSPENSGAGTAASASARRGVVICDSLFEEKFWCERVFSNLGRYLSDKGNDVLVFDYYGYGNSVGRSVDVDAGTLERDINDACDLLAGNGVNRITLVGVRWGGALACRAAVNRADVDSVLLINPVTKWKTELSKALRANVAGQYALFRGNAMTRDEITEELLAGGDCVRSGYKLNNIEGYVFSRSFLEDADRMEVPLEFPDRIKSVCVYTIPEKKTSAPQTENKLAVAIRSAGTNCDDVTLEEENPFWLNPPTFTSIAPGLNVEFGRRIAQIDTGTGGANGSAGAELHSVDTIEHDGVKESVVSFDSSDGHRLYGVLYLPANSEMKDVAFVFSHGGLIGMTGAFRFHTRAARRFASAGYPCLCFDPHGLGRAQGTPGNRDKVVFFRDVNIGMLADDVGDAVSFLEKKIGRTEVALFGVCGGAITSLIAQSRFPNIGVSILASNPVMLPSLRGATRRMTSGYAKYNLGIYVRKILNPRAWWRFLTFRSEYKNILKMLKAVGGGALKRLGLKKHASTGEHSHTPSDEDLRFNDVFLDSYRAVIGREDRILLFFGENDNFRFEFHNEFVEHYPGDFEAGQDHITVEEIPRANHMYTLREWQDHICEYCLSWVENTLLSRETLSK